MQSLPYWHWRKFLSLLTKYDDRHGSLNKVVAQQHLYESKWAKPATAKTEFLHKQAISFPRKKLQRYAKNKILRHYYKFATAHNADDIGALIQHSVHEVGDAQNGIPAAFGAASITRVRAFVVDVDIPVSAHAIQNVIAETKPTMVVASSVNHETGNSKYHLYYLVDGYDESLLIPSVYKKFQQAFAYRVDQILCRCEGALEVNNFYSEITLSSLVVKLRTPGFNHQKKQGIKSLVSLVYWCESDVINLGAFDASLGYRGITAELMEQAERVISEAVNSKLQGLIDTSVLLKDYSVPTSTALDITDTENPLISTYPHTVDGSRNNTMLSYVWNVCFRKMGMTYTQALGACLYEDAVRNEPPLGEEVVTDLVSRAYLWKVDTEVGEAHTAGTAFSGLSAYLEAAGIVKPQLLEKSPEALNAEYRVKDRLEFLEKLKTDKDEKLVVEYDFSNGVYHDPMLSDMSLVGMYIQKYGYNFKCNPGLGGFVYQEDAGIWEPDDIVAYDYFRDVINDAKTLKPFQIEFIDDSGSYSKDRRNSFFTTQLSASHQNSLVKSLEKQSILRLELNDTNQGRTLLCAKNGVIDLSTGELKPHNRDLYMTSSVDAQYSPEWANHFLDTAEGNIKWQDAGVWSRFIWDVMSGRPEMCRFLMKVIGHSLVQGNDTQKLFFFYGLGANGKSILTEMMRRLLGSYLCHIRPETLTENKSDTISMSELSGLFGARIALSDETEKGSTWNESLVKRLTGDSTIKVKKYHCDPIDIEMTASFLISGNNKPIVSGTDRGIWRRLCIIPFKREFSEKEQMNITKEMMLERLSAVQHEILAWCMAGSLLYTREGLEYPALVQKELLEYKQDYNPVDVFMQTVINPTPLAEDVEHGVSGNDLYTLFKDVWSSENLTEVHFSTELAFKRALRDKGFKLERTVRRDGKSFRVYDLALNDEWAEKLKDVREGRTGGDNVAYLQSFR